MGFLVSRTNVRPGGAARWCSLLLAVLAPSGARRRRTPEPGAAPAGSYHFAFVTNNSSDFWNIGEKGLRKARRTWA